jgi:hypothetical protein
MGEAEEMAVGSWQIGGTDGGCWMQDGNGGDPGCWMKGMRRRWEM